MSEFTASDFTTPLWLKIKKMQEAKLQRYREVNDGQLDEITTARLRGKISEVKAFLKIDRLPETPDKQKRGT